MSEKDEKIIFARNLRQALDSTGTSQQKLAEVVGVSEASVSFWLSADRYPSPGKVQKIADFLGIRKTQLIDDAPPVPVEIDRVFRKLQKLTPVQLQLVENLIDQFLE